MDYVHDNTSPTFPTTTTAVAGGGGVSGSDVAGGGAEGVLDSRRNSSIHSGRGLNASATTTTVENKSTGNVPQPTASANAPFSSAIYKAPTVEDLQLVFSTALHGRSLASLYAQVAGNVYDPY